MALCISFSCAPVSVRPYPDGLPHFFTAIAFSLFAVGFNTQEPAHSLRGGGSAAGRFIFTFLPVIPQWIYCLARTAGGGCYFSRVAAVFFHANDNSTSFFQCRFTQLPAVLLFHSSSIPIDLFNNPVGYPPTFGWLQVLRFFRLKPGFKPGKTAFFSGCCFCLMSICILPGQ
jgi:hypothetical protein